MRAGIYCRISLDSAGDELGVERQKADCAAETERQGWTIAGYYVDNDISASSGVRRPEYQRMLKDAASGAIDAIVVYDISRLTRTPRELEDIIILAERHSVGLANVSGSVNLSTPDGRLMARTMGTFARYEVEQLSKRLARKFLEKAQRGEPHGYAPYGFMRIDPIDEKGIPTGAARRDLAHPEHADIVREAARRVLALESLRSVTADFNARGIPGPKAGKWNSTILRQILLRPTNAGLRSYQGKIIGPSTSEALYDEATHTRLVALLRDPARRSNFAGSEPRYLLGGIALCGLCGGPMRRQIGKIVTSKRTGQTKNQPSSYGCSACFKVRRIQDRVDQVVSSAVIARLSQPDARQIFAVGDSAAVAAAQARIEVANAKLAEAASMFAKDEIDAGQLRRVTADLRTVRSAAERDLEAGRPRSALTDLVVGDVATGWHALPVSSQRDIVNTLMVITILPTGGGLAFDPRSVAIEWRTGNSAT
jgi:site-specific DNA recombinase